MSKVSDNIRIPSSSVTMEAIADELDAIDAKINALDNYAFFIDAATAVTSSTTLETTIFTATVPANTLSTDQFLRFTSWGYVENTSGAGNNTTTWRMKFGGSEFFNYSYTLGDTENDRAVFITGTVQAQTTTTQDCMGRLTLGVTGTNDSSDMGADQTEALASDSLSVTATSSQAFVLTVQHTLADVDASYTFYGGFLEFLR